MNSFISLLLTALSCLLLVTGCRQITDGSNDFSLSAPYIYETKSIFISSPSAREIYKRGDVILIKWIPPRATSKVDILLYKKSELKVRVKQNFENNGEIEWQIPNDIPYSNHYKIKLVNTSNLNEFGYSGMFGIQSD